MIAPLTTASGKSAVNGIQNEMALGARLTPARNQNVASEETQLKTAAQSTDAKEHTKKRTKPKQTAQQQQDAQPEAENLSQGLIQMEAPKAPEAEDDDVRRVSNEFVLRWSLEAQDHVNGKPADFIKLVNSSAYARIYIAEAVLCGAMVFPTIGRVAPVEKFDKWWASFKVGDLWFVLRYHDTPIREYELVPAFGPTPGDGGPPPTMTRKQSRPPPTRIGQRPRRNRGDAQGSRASTAGKKIKSAAKGAKKKIDGATRAIIEQGQRMVREIEARNVSFITDINHLWRQNSTRVNDAICDARLICGSALQTLRGVCGTFVQETLALMDLSRASFTQVDDGATKTHGPSGHLADSDAGHGIFRRLELKSWKWKTHPIAWNDDLFGVLWTNDLFGVREEERAYT